MEKEKIEIIWSNKALSDLEAIFYFLADKSDTAARETVKKIGSKVSILKKGMLKIGITEPLLEGYPK